MKSLIWPTATNGCEGWTLKKADQKCIEAFEMWGFRRLLRIPWTQRKTNEWILEKLNEDRQLLNSIKTRKIRYYGHVMRKPSLPFSILSFSGPAFSTPANWFSIFQFCIFSVPEKPRVFILKMLIFTIS